MALIKIESGEVTRIVGQNGAFAVGEEVSLPDGRSFMKQYTVWNHGEAPQVGQIVSVIGQFSAKIREYDSPTGKKQAIDVSINDPEVTLMGVPAPVQAEPVQAPQAPADDGLPF